MGHELVVLGLAFLLAGLLARGGRRIGLPTIPLFVGAGILAGPNTGGPAHSWPREVTRSRA
jgi:K+:H+ antiporter subunit KhtU